MALTIPTWFLALNYWVHLMATIIWLSGLAVITALAWPGMLPLDGLIDRPADLAEELERRFRPYTNLSLAALLATGMVQMGANPNYEGWFALANSWSVVILIKHMAFGGIILVAGIAQLAVLPALDRARLIGAEGGRNELSLAYQQLRAALAVSLTLGVVALTCTAIMTAL